MLSFGRVVSSNTSVEKQNQHIASICILVAPSLGRPNSSYSWWETLEKRDLYNIQDISNTNTQKKTYQWILTWEVLTSNVPILYHGMKNNNNNNNNISRTSKPSRNYHKIPCQEINQKFILELTSPEKEATGKPPKIWWNAEKNSWKTHETLWKNRTNNLAKKTTGQLRATAIFSIQWSTASPNTIKTTTSKLETIHTPTKNQLPASSIRDPLISQMEIIYIKPLKKSLKTFKHPKRSRTEEPGMYIYIYT